MRHSSLDHTFAILAYQESPYLEECILSLKNQTVKSQIVITTSTPSRFLERISQKHGLPLLVNGNRSGIASDWSFGYLAADTRYVTLAHQDDLYYPSYTDRCLEQAEGLGKILIIFTNYDELVNGKICGHRMNMIIKQMILFPFFLVDHNLKGRLFKKWMLSFGSPIPCPSVMYNREEIGHFEFSNEFRVNLDWDAWIRLSERTGDFVFVKERLMAHRIHPGSATTRAIEVRIREAEDITLFRRTWGSVPGYVIALLYRLSYFSNG